MEMLPDILRRYSGSEHVIGPSADLITSCNSEEFVKQSREHVFEEIVEEIKGAFLRHEQSTSLRFMARALCFCSQEASEYLKPYGKTALSATADRLSDHLNVSFAIFSFEIKFRVKPNVCLHAGEP